TWGAELNPAAVMLPKAESPDALGEVHERLNGVAVLPIIESAAGFAALSVLAGATGVLRLAIGHIDFMADTGVQCDEGEPELPAAPRSSSMAGWSTCRSCSRLDGRWRGPPRGPRTMNDARELPSFIDGYGSVRPWTGLELPPAVVTRAATRMCPANGGKDKVL